jgi:peptidoglycan/xylan/chitin deacetylase (PgdA/CDA1 family)
MLFHIRKFTKRLNSFIIRNLIGTITHIKTYHPVVALTFDDGPDPEFTPKVLGILSRYDACATFFMVGYAANLYPEIVKMVAEKGHAIGNHSWDHPSFPLINGLERRLQIKRCEKALKPYSLKLFRPPYGDQDFKSRVDAFLLGYKVITWNIVAFDWLDHDAEFMVKRVSSKIKGGSIILFHDSLYQTVEEKYLDRTPMLKALDILLERLSDKYRFITIPEMFRYGRKGCVSWHQNPTIGFLNNLKSRFGAVRQYT